MLSAHFRIAIAFVAATVPQWTTLGSDVEPKPQPEIKLDLADTFPGEWGNAGLRGKYLLRYPESGTAYLSVDDCRIKVDGKPGSRRFSTVYKGFNQRSILPMMGGLYQFENVFDSGTTPIFIFRQRDTEILPKELQPQRDSWFIPYLAGETRSSPVGGNYATAECSGTGTVEFNHHLRVVRIYPTPKPNVVFRAVVEVDGFNLHGENVDLGVDETLSFKECGFLVRRVVPPSREPPLRGWLELSPKAIVMDGK